MTFSAAPTKLPPRPPLVKTIGVLNIVFGGLLMLCGPCPGLMTLALPSLMPMLEKQQQVVRDRLETNKRRELEALAQQEKTASTEEEKQRIRAEKAAKESEPIPIAPSPDMSQFGLDDVRVRLHYGLDAVSCLFFNLLMLISGFGIMRFARWGRSLGITIAWLKLIRLVALTLSMVFVVAPFMNPKSASMMAQMAEQGAAAAPGAPPKSAEQKAQEVQEMTASLRNFNLMIAVGFGLLGAIYPITQLAVLSSRSAKDAFSEPSM